jgi:hypothetical protein
MWVADVTAKLGHDGNLLGDAAREVVEAPAREPASTDSDAEATVLPGAETPLAMAGAAEVTPTTPGEPAAPAAKTVLLVGDSLMSVGLAPGLANAMKSMDQYKIIRASRSATGLSRPDAFDWQAQIQRLVAKHKPDYVVVAIGGNDAQGFKVGKKIYHVGTADWDQVYAERVKTFMASATSRGAKLLWVGIPIVRDKSFWKNLSHLNALAKSVAESAGGASYLDSSPFLTGSDGQFASYLADAKGRELRVRADDGIHLTDSGGARVAKGVLAWLQKQR